MNKQMLWIFIIVALFVGAFGGYYYEKSKLTSQMMMTQSLQKQLQDAKMTNDKLMKDQSAENEKMMQASPEPSGMMMHTTITPTGGMMEK